MAEEPRTGAASGGEATSARKESALVMLSYRCCCCCCWKRGQPDDEPDWDGDSPNGREELLLRLPLMLVGTAEGCGLMVPPLSTVNLPFLDPPPLDVRHGFTVILLLDPAAAPWEPLADEGLACAVVFGRGAIGRGRIALRREADELVVVVDWGLSFEVVDRGDNAPKGEGG